ncbi:hypothetical protein KKD52_06390 [Myxococcota bacterium]|nr:hypothetical protein [Myxococcota bacterium]MBU1412010.1 hypothetical protein [Myxococcota bacterium]MBU1509972.1 hypothetical protein [Myxococcota bacterium]
MKSTTAIEVHHRFELPVATQGVRPAGLSVGDTVWALLPYPSDPKKFRLTLGTLVAADDGGATVENSGSITGPIPWSIVRPRTRAEVKAGQAVLAAGAAGVFVGRVATAGDPVEVHRVWRLESRLDRVAPTDLFVQNGTREFGQVVFFQDRGIWNQGLWILGEERHAWVVQSLGGAVLRISSVETHPWNPAFVPVLGQEVEACRSAAAVLQRATIYKAPAHGLFYEIRLSTGATRQRVPFWEILPQGSVL